MILKLLDMGRRDNKTVSDDMTRMQRPLMKSYVECRLRNKTCGAGLMQVYRFQDSLLEEHKGDIKGMQQMKRKNLGLMLDQSWTQQAPYQDH